METQASTSSNIDDSIRIKKKALQIVLQQCQVALQLLSRTDEDEPINDENFNRFDDEEESGREPETDELCELIKSRLVCPDFLDKIASAQVSAKQNIAGMQLKKEEGSTWDVVSENDLWEEGSISSDEDYVVVKQEDIVDGIASFTAAYLLSIKQTKDLTPNQLQEALGKTFSVRKHKGKLRKAWDGSKVVYNVASWGATAIGIYQNPVILRVATKAFWTSCHVISKLR